MFRVVRTLLALVLIVSCSAPPPPVEEAPAPSGAYRDEALARLGTIEEKIVGLAEEMPQDSYTWRPMEGVRSVSEVFLHVAAANYGLPGNFGTPPPEGFSFGGYDKQTTDKWVIVPRVKASFAHIRRAVEKLTAADADKAVKMFGQDMTMRQAVWAALEHLSEHLGQSIAYARSNKVVPAWSAGDN